MLIASAFTKVKDRKKINEERKRCMDKHKRYISATEYNSVFKRKGILMQDTIWMDP